MPSSPIDKEWALRGTGAHALPEQFTGEAKVLLQALRPKDGGELQIEPERVHLRLPYPLIAAIGGQPLAEATVDLFDRMARLIQALRVDLGPYR